MSACSWKTHEETRDHLLGKYFHSIPSCCPLLEISCCTVWEKSRWPYRDPRFSEPAQAEFPLSFNPNLNSLRVERNCSECTPSNRFFFPPLPLPCHRTISQWNCSERPRTLSYRGRFLLVSNPKKTDCGILNHRLMTSMWTKSGQLEFRLNWVT